jgi:hypothetical protein
MFAKLRRVRKMTYAIWAWVVAQDELSAVCVSEPPVA